MIVDSTSEAANRLLDLMAIPADPVPSPDEPPSEQDDYTGLYGYYVSGWYGYYPNDEGCEIE